MLGKILVIEDDHDAAKLAQLQLEKVGYKVSIAADGDEGLRQAYAWGPDLILLDILMPTMSGWSVCERLREITDVPVIFLTVLGQEKHIVQGLKLGADDYITKPYNAQELLARIEAVLRRWALADAVSGTLTYADLKIDLDRRRVTRGEKTISLTPLEFKLLACLAERPGKSLSHQYLMRRVWGASNQSRNSLKLYIWYLRRKLESNPSKPKIILTERGVGYRLSPPEH